MARAAKRYDAGKGIFMSNWKILLYRVKVVELEDVNIHTKKKDKARQEISQSCLIVASVAYPSCLKYALEDLSKEDVGVTFVVYPKGADASKEEATAKIDDGVQA